MEMTEEQKAKFSKTGKSNVRSAKVHERRVAKLLTELPLAPDAEQGHQHHALQQVLRRNRGPPHPRVHLVGKPGSDAGAGLDIDVVSVRDQMVRTGGHECHAILVGLALYPRLARESAVRNDCEP